MPRLRGIPPRARAGLKKLLALEPSTKEELVTALQAESAALHTGALTAAIRGKIRVINDSDLEEILDALVSLSYGRMRADMTIQDFAGELVRLDEVGIELDNRAEVRTFLESALNTSAISGTAKVNDVITETERLFLSARIVTDIRPIFGDSPAETLGAAVVHMLKISYHSALEDLDFYVAMDDEDLTKLQEVLGRAEGKARNMRAMLEKAGIREFRDTEGSQ